MKPARDAVEILHRRFYEGRPARLKTLEEARANEEIASKIRELRAAASLTQAQLAKLIGTTAPATLRNIAREWPSEPASSRRLMTDVGRGIVRLAMSRFPISFGLLAFKLASSPAIESTARHASSSQTASAR